MLAWEKGWGGGDKKIIMYRGTPAQFFFQCINLVIFFAKLGGLSKFVWMGWLSRYFRRQSLDNN